MPEPETVWVSSPAGSVEPGPSDGRMHTVYAVGKSGRPYGINYGPYGTPHLYLPPWGGRVHAPAAPGPSGHFDHLEVGTYQFEAAHVYGTVRWVLDIWEDYFDQRIELHSARDLDRLELTLIHEFDNAHVGYGFLEVGAHMTEEGGPVPLSLNFDVIAHEVGHGIINSLLGVPDRNNVKGEYFGFHESAGDLLALVSVLHFDSVVEELLERTHGNLYVTNRLNRFGEISPTEQIRLASNASTLSDFKDGWYDPHYLSLPLTAALFDVFVDIFHERLVQRRLIGRQVEELADIVEARPELEPMIQSEFVEAYARNPQAFGEVLRGARDELAQLLVRTWRQLSPESLDYALVGAALLNADRAVAGGKYRSIIARNFHRRGIGRVRPGPRRGPPMQNSHAFWARTLVREDQARLPKMSYRENMIVARQAAMAKNAMYSQCVDRKAQ